MLSYREKHDIADFDLKSFLEEKTKAGEIHSGFKIVAIAKHLCGGATDLALTSLRLQDPSKALAITIATCCHHSCDSRTYVNLDYLKEYFEEGEVTILPRFSSWAISP
jgi:tRNA:m4X modification enzyme